LADLAFYYREAAVALLPATKNRRVSANYDGRKNVLSDLATDHHVTRREAAAALKARNIPAQGKQR